MHFGDHFKIKASDRYEWSLEEFSRLHGAKQTLVEFCPNSVSDRVRPYLDLDGKADVIESLPAPDVIYPHLRRLLVDVFGEDTRLLCAYKPNRSVRVDKNKTVHKMSFRFFLPDLYTFPKAMKMVAQDINTLLRSDIELQQLLERTTECSFDEGIYSRWRGMSVVNKIKDKSDPIVLRPWRTDCDVPQEDFLITNVTDNCSELVYTTCVDMKDTKQSPTMPPTCGGKLKAFIAQHFVAAIDGVSHKNQDDRCVFINLKKKICPFALREHSSNRQFVTICKVQNKWVAFEKCHKAECALQQSTDKTGRKIPVDAIVLKELQLEASEDSTAVENTLQSLIKMPLVRESKESATTYECRPSSAPKLMPNGSYTIPLSNELPCPICKRTHDQATNNLVVGQGFRYVTCSLKPTEWYPDPPAVISMTQNQIIFAQNFTQNVYNNVTSGSESALVTTNLLPSDFENDNLPVPSVASGDAEMKRIFLTALNGKHLDVAQFVYAMYHDQFRCLGHNREWFQYKQHVWCEVSSDIIEYELMKDDFMQHFTAVLSYYMQQDGGDKLLRSKKQKVQELYDNLKSHGFRNSVLKECEVIFLGRHPSFEEDLNTRNLLPCTNGVVDLDTLEFRDGHVEDAMSMSTKCQYIPYDATNGTVKDIEAWMALVQPDPEQCAYLKKLSGYFLTNKTTMQQVQVFTGRGRNGKSFYVEQILKPAMGQFYITGATQLLTRKRENASETNEAMIALLKKRVAVFSEPEKNEVIQASIIKQLSGCDEITARGLHQKQQSANPTFKGVLICNTIPKVSEDSYAVWRRIRIVDWPMTFKDDPDPSNRLEALLDTDFADKVKHWAPYFLGCLVHWLRLYRQEGLKEPASVIAHTLAYQEDNDEFIEFRKQYIIYKEGEGVSWSDLREKFRCWHNENISQFNGKKMTPRGDEVKKYFIAKLCPETFITLKGQRVRGFKNFHCLYNTSL